MYNKIFTKILDSSIWMESTTTRLVWLTFIAAMDEQGFAQFASSMNVAHRARVTFEEAEEALKILESPDSHSADHDNDGRRIEKIPGGWLVLNAHKYRDLVTKAVIQEQTKARVKRYREHKKGLVEPVESPCNAPVTQGNENVTASEAVSEAKAKKKGVVSTNPLHPLIEDEWIETILKKNPLYSHINVDRELLKMDQWLQENKHKGRLKTKRFVTNWLNNIEVPLPPQSTNGVKKIYGC